MASRNDFIAAANMLQESTRVPMKSFGFVDTPEREADRQSAIEVCESCNQPIVNRQAHSQSHAPQPHAAPVSQDVPVRQAAQAPSVNSQAPPQTVQPTMRDPMSRPEATAIEVPLASPQAIRPASPLASPQSPTTRQPEPIVSPPGPEATTDASGWFDSSPIDIGSFGAPVPTPAPSAPSVSQPTELPSKMQPDWGSLANLPSREPGQRMDVSSVQPQSSQASANRPAAEPADPGEFRVNPIGRNFSFEGPNSQQPQFSGQQQSSFEPSVDSSSIQGLGEATENVISELVRTLSGIVTQLNGLGLTLNELNSRIEHGDGDGF